MALMYGVNSSECAKGQATPYSRLPTPNWIPRIDCMWFHRRWKPRIVDWFGIQFTPWLCT